MKQRTEVTYRSDDGVSLIELIVYVVVLGVVMAGIVTVFVNTWNTQASVTSQTQATTRGQVVSQQIERAVRNAAGLFISADGSTLEVLTELAGAKECQGFALTASGLQMTISTSPASSPSAWPVWQTRISAVGGTPTFQSVGANGVSGVRYTFDATDDSAPVHFAGTVYTRQSVSGVVDPCWTNP